MLNPIVFREIWQKPELESGSKDYWREVFKTARFDLDKRSKEVVFHAILGHRIIGLSTAQLLFLPEYNNNAFYNFRISVHPDYRMPGLADKLCVETILFLEEFTKRAAKPAVGVVTVIEDKRIHLYKRNTVYSASGLIFGGYTQNGAQIRLKYFDDVTI